MCNIYHKDKVWGQDHAGDIMLSCVIVMIYVDIYMYNMYVYIQWLRFMYVRRPLAGPDLLALWFVFWVVVLMIRVRSEAGPCIVRLYYLFLYKAVDCFYVTSWKLNIVIKIVNNYISRFLINVLYISHILIILLLY